MTSSPDETPLAPVELSPDESRFLDEAAQYLEQPSLLMRLADAVGKPVEALTSMAPDAVNQTVQAALGRALSLAIATIEKEEPNLPEPETIQPKRDFWHTFAGAVTGAGGGFFGIAGLAVELPVTTTIMLRSIASIAGKCGENLHDPGVRLQCLTVFGLASPAKAAVDKTPEIDAMESSYLTSRMAMQETVRQAAAFAGKMSGDQLARAIRDGTAPAIVRLIGKVAARFNIAVTEKFLAQSIPVVGAAGGAAVNVAFIDHFNRVAGYHFGIRRLERKYSVAAVQHAYRQAVARAD